MQASTRFADAIHIMTYIYVRQNLPDLSSKTLSFSVNTSSVTIRQITSQLSKAGLLNTRKGSKKVSLTKDPKEISLYEIFLAISTGQVFKRDENTSITCQIGQQMPNIIDHVFNDIEDTVKAKLKTMTLDDVIKQVQL